MKILDKNEIRAIEGGKKKIYTCEKCSNHPTFDSWIAYAMHNIAGIFISEHYYN